MNAQLNRRMFIISVDQVFNTCSYALMPMKKKDSFRVALSPSLLAQMETAARSMQMTVEKLGEKFLLEGVKHRQNLNPFFSANPQTLKKRKEAAKNRKKTSI